MPITKPRKSARHPRRRLDSAVQKEERATIIAIKKKLIKAFPDPKERQCYLERVIFDLGAEIKQAEYDKKHGKESEIENG